jgi:cystathionine beta-lyase/cystathionine gamma-synthase
MVSVALAAEHEQCVRCVNGLRLIASAVSHWHDEVLVAYEQYSQARVTAFAQAFRNRGLIRIAVGQESAPDPNRRRQRRVQAAPILTKLT